MIALPVGYEEGWAGVEQGLGLRTASSLLLVPGVLPTVLPARREFGRTSQKGFKKNTSGHKFELSFA
jgi:hypothetical protein